MTKRTLTRNMRDHFGAKRPDGKPLPALPMKDGTCGVCGGPTKTADGSICKYHKCCRKYKNNRFAAQQHIREFHS
jgi:hypothetical protein